MPPLPGRRPDDDSVAGEEDPGASLEVLTPRPPPSATDAADPSAPESGGAQPRKD
jgi:hypothetical protein